MAEISDELLENEWVTYNGMKNFLNLETKVFGVVMNSKYKFENDSLTKMSDSDAYNTIKQKHTRKIDDMRK